MSSPSVSVGITVKNGEKYIAESIESILDQEYEALEILVVDDYSSDDTVKIARSFPKVKIVERDRTGIGNGWNTAVNNASGDLISFLTHDDIWTRDKLKLQVKHLQANPAILFVVSQLEYFLEFEDYIPDGFRTELLGQTPAGLTPNTLLARPEVFDVVGLFNEDLSTGEDLDWFSRAKDLSVAYAVIPKVLLKVRIHKSNTSWHSNENNQNLLKLLKASIERKKKIRK